MPLARGRARRGQRGGPDRPRTPAPGAAGRPPRHRPAGRRERGAPDRGRHPVGGGLGRHEGRPGRHARPGRDHPRAGGGRHLVLLRLRGGGPGVSGLRHLWEHRPDLLAGDAAILGEPTGGRGGGRLPGHDAGPHLAGRACGPTRPGPSPGATPSTGWPRCWTPWPATRADGRCSTAASTPSSSRRWRSTGGWPATWCPTRPAGGQPPFRPGPDAGRGRGAALQELLGTDLEPE